MSVCRRRIRLPNTLSTAGTHFNLVKERFCSVITQTTTCVSVPKVTVRFDTCKLALVLGATNISCTNVTYTADRIFQYQFTFSVCTAEAFSDYSPTEDSNNSSLETLVQEHALKFWNLGASWNDSEITSSDSTLPPLASAKELPEDIRDELKPTPLAEMLAQDLYATAFTESMPEDALMLRVDSKSPWVQHLSIFGGNKVPLIHVADQQERTLPRQHSSNHHGETNIELYRQNKLSITFKLLLVY